MTNTRALLDFIGGLEAPKGYDQIYGGIKKDDYPPKPITSMTIGEVLAWQDRINPKYRSEASGRFQFLRVTLRNLAKQLNIPLTSKFSRDMQDRLAIELMNQRGLRKFMAGSISNETFANNLAKEWASLPCVSGPKVGKSYYDGDGLNTALTTPRAILTAIETLKEEPAKKPRTSISQSTTIQASATQVAAGATAAGTAVGALDGDAQKIVLIFAGIVILAALWVMRERIKKWADGIR